MGFRKVRKSRDKVRRGLRKMDLQKEIWFKTARLTELGPVFYEGPTLHGGIYNMKAKTIFAAFVFLFVGSVLALYPLWLSPEKADAQTAGSPYRIAAASVDCAGAGAAALAVRFNTITIRADPNNAGSICIGGSTVTCTHAAAAAVTDGIKLRAGDAITLEGGQWPSGTLYLNNTSANDDFSYIALY